VVNCKCPGVPAPVTRSVGLTCSRKSATVEQIGALGQGFYSARAPQPCPAQTSIGSGQKNAALFCAIETKNKLREHNVANVALDNAGKVYGSRQRGVRALDDVSLTVEDGEFLVLVGPSGCGKTTLLRLIAGLETPTEGTIRIADRIVNKISPKNRDVAMVFQDYALYPHMTVRKNIAFGLKMRKTPRREIERAVQAMADLLGLTDLLDRHPGELSGGEQQRVALGRAIVRKPNVFLFDEPLSNLDARLRLQMRAELKKLHAKLKTTTLYVTHDQEEAVVLGQRVAVMNRGRILQIGTPIEIYENPASRFVAEFIDLPPMNFIKGRVMTDSDAVIFDGALGRWTLPNTVAKRLQPFQDGAIDLGIRPGHLSLAKASQGADQTSAQGRVSLVENLGHHVQVRWVGESGAELLVLCAVGASASPGEKVDVIVDLAQAHFFAGDDEGQRLA